MNYIYTVKYWGNTDRGKRSRKSVRFSTEQNAIWFIKSLEEGDLISWSRD